MNGDEEQNENAPVDEQRLDQPEAVPEQIEASAEQPAGQQDGAPAVKPEPVRPKGPHIPLPGSLQEIVGALLFASETPLTVGDLRSCVRGVAPEEGDDPDVMSVYQSCTTREIEQALRGLEKELERSGCGFVLVCAGGAYRLQTASQCGRYVRALLKLDRPNRLSRAALETLAIIAYRQPITKAEIEQIRGVAVDTIVKSLVDLQLVRLVGRSELPGHPFLYGTSPLFLEHFGLASLSELNEIDPTLQRSNPRERAKLFVKEKKPDQPTLEDAAKEAAAAKEGDVAEKAAAPEGDAPAGENAEGLAEGEAAEEEAPRERVAFRPDDEEEFVDDAPDAFDDDEPLVDDEDGDDESLVDDEEDDDDESLVDDDEDDDSDDDDGDTAEGDDDEEDV